MKNVNEMAYLINVTNVASKRLLRIGPELKLSNRLYNTEVKGLEPYAKYMVQIKACITTFCSQSSKPIYAFTREEGEN